VVIVGSIIGIASGDAESGAPVVVVTEGCFTLPKVATDAITAGERVYWDSDPGICTDVSTDNTLLGVAIEAAPNPSGTVKVRLSGAF
jgi:predicted RecA/RadA family phage recombinase